MEVRAEAWAEPGEPDVAVDHDDLEAAPGSVQQIEDGRELAAEELARAVGRDRRRGGEHLACRGRVGPFAKEQAAGVRHVVAVAHIDAGEHEPMLPCVSWLDHTLIVGNCSGFYGDRFSAVQEMLEGGRLDVLTGDYLAELTMLILGRDRMKDPNTGYAKTFLRQMKASLALAIAKKVKVVVNAGGLNPAGLAAAVRALSIELGVAAKVAHVEGDDLISRASELGLGSPLTANAYLGAWGITECLKAGADIVITGRVTDASLVVGAAAAHFEWKRNDWNALAGAVVAGHVLECGAQATGGNFAFFTEIELGRPGFPIAEIEEDGSCIITKHAHTGGAVTVDTVRAQIVYENPDRAVRRPDVTTRFDTVKVIQDATDRVRIHDAVGEPPPPTLKVCLNHVGGFRNDASFILVGLDIEAKAKLVRAQDGSRDDEEAGGADLEPAPHRSRGRRRRGARLGGPARRREGQGSERGGPIVQRRGSGARALELSGLHDDGAPGRRPLRTACTARSTSRPARSRMSRSCPTVRA